MPQFYQFGVLFSFLEKGINGFWFEAEVSSALYSSIKM